MSPIASIFVFATLAFLATSQVCGHAKPEVYFSQPTPQEAVENEQWRTALVSLQLDPDLSTTDLLSTLNRAAQATSNSVDRKVYTMLEQLFTDIAVDPENLVRLSILIYNGMETPELAKFKPYMLSIAQPSIVHHANLAEQELGRFQVAKPSETVHLDNFFRAAVYVYKLTSDTDFLHKLKKFDLAKDDYNAPKAYGVAKSFNNPKRPSGRQEIFESFLDVNCDKIAANPLKYFLDVLNLAVGLDSEYRMTTRAQLVNQYRRICRTWTQQDGWLNIVSNFECQMPRPSGLRRLFGSCAGGDS